MSSKKLTNDKFNVLMAWTPKSMPSNPTARGWSAERIKEFQYKGFELLYQYLDEVETNLINNKLDYAITGGHGILIDKNELTISFTGSTTDRIATASSYTFYDVTTPSDSTLTTAFSNISAALAHVSTAISGADNKIDAEVTKIENGTTIAGKAKSDANGNQIDSTYQTIAQHTADKAADKAYTDALKTSIQNGVITAGKAERDANGNVLNADDYITHIQLAYNTGNGLLSVIGLNSKNEQVSSESFDLPTETAFNNISWKVGSSTTLVFSLADGSHKEFDLSNFVDTYTGTSTISSTVETTVNDHTIIAKVKNGSITPDHLSDALKEQILAWESNEQTRISNETERQANELARTIAETARANAELDRNATLNEMVNDYDSRIGTIDSKISECTTKINQIKSGADTKIASIQSQADTKLSSVESSLNNKFDTLEGNITSDVTQLKADLAEDYAAKKEELDDEFATLQSQMATASQALYIDDTKRDKKYSYRFVLSATGKPQIHFEEIL